MGDSMWVAQWKAASVYLSARDPVLADLIARYGGEMLRPSGDAFTTLANAVIGQQISVTAADAIWKRLVQKYPAGAGFLDLTLVEAADLEDLRTCGLSLRKAEYLKGLCLAFTEGVFLNAAWKDWSDAELEKALVSLRGIGPWTAHMFLIFHLGRWDVLPVDDLGLLKAFRLGYTDGSPTNKELKKLIVQHAQAHWKPYCTVATWYLWRGLDPDPVAY